MRVIYSNHFKKTQRVTKCLLFYTGSLNVFDVNEENIPCRCMGREVQHDGDEFVCHDNAFTIKYVSQS